MKETEQDLKPVLAALNGINMHESDNSASYLIDVDFKPINIDLVNIQISLSKVIQQVDQLKAANVAIRFILNKNKKVLVDELQNFFILLEVYGSLNAVNSFDPHLMPLYMQRRKALKDLLMVRMRIMEAFDTLQDQIEDAPAKLGSVWTDLLEL